MSSTQVIRVAAVQMPSAQAIRRSTTMRARLGRRLNPTQVTDAWYAADCPPKLDTSGLSRRVRLQWALACWLRGVKR